MASTTSSLASTSPSGQATPTQVLANSILVYDDDSDFDPPYSTATSLADTSIDYGATVNDVETIADKQQGIVYQYYFLILIVGVLFIIALSFCMRRRRRRRKFTAAHLGRNALARDLESWQPTDAPRAAPPTTARRWMNRLGTRGLGRTPEEDEHGLNEFGEAPPPYKTQEAALEAGNVVPAPNMLTVPLRTLSRSAIGKPPGYDESISGTSTGTSLSSLSDRQSRLSTLQPNASNPELQPRPTEPVSVLSTTTTTTTQLETTNHTTASHP